MGKLSPVGRRLGDVRQRLRARTQRRDEDGFILLESIIAISLITVIMGALATFTINAVSLTGEQRARQAATQLATGAMSDLRSIPATDIVTGRGSTAVRDQIALGKKNTAVEPYLRSMTDTFSQPGIAAGAGATALVPTEPTTPAPTLNGVTYTVNTYLGECVVATGSPDCVLGGTGTTFVRAVVAVTWADSSCPTTITGAAPICTYVTSTLINRDDDPIFNTAQTAATAPVPVSPGNQTSTVGASESLQLTVRSGTGVPTYTWSVTAGALPAGLTLSASGLISGSPATAAAAKAVTVMVIDAFGRSGTMTFNWTVVAAPTVTKPAAQSSAVGQTVSVAVASTCANSPCTFTLNNAPAGITINPTTGAIGGAATTAGTYATVTVAIKDADNVTATTAAFTWTVVTGPTIGAPGTLTATIGNAKSVAIAYTCPGPPCTLTLSGTVPGMGLATTAVTTNNTATTLSLPAASGTFYIAGTVQTTAITTGTSKGYTPTVKITNTGSGANVTSAAGAWTVFAKPTVGALAARTVNVGAPVNVPIAYTCPNAPCTLALVNTAAAKVPGLGLSAVDGATATNNTASLVVSAASGTVYINGTVSGTAVTTGQTKTYAMSLSITDSASVASAASTATWTASRAPKIADPGSQAVEPNQNLTLAMSTSCSNGGCSTWSAQVQIVGDTNWYTIPISNTGVISYPNASPAGNYTARVTVTDGAGYSDTVTFGLKVQDFSLSIPTKSSTKPGTVTLDVAALMNPTADGYTYTLSGQPGWLTIDANGLMTATLVAGSTSDSAITVTVTSSASSTSTVSTTFAWNIS